MVPFPSPVRAFRYFRVHPIGLRPCCPVFIRVHPQRRILPPHLSNLCNGSPVNQPRNLLIYFDNSSTARNSVSKGLCFRNNDRLAFHYCFLFLSIHPRLLIHNQSVRQFSGPARNLPLNIFQKGKRSFHFDFWPEFISNPRPLVS